MVESGGSLMDVFLCKMKFNHFLFCWVGRGWDGCWKIGRDGMGWEMGGKRGKDEGVGLCILNISYCRCMEQKQNGGGDGWDGSRF